MRTQFCNIIFGEKETRSSPRDKIHFSRDDDDKRGEKKPLSRFLGFGAHEHSWCGRGTVTSIGRNRRRVVPGSDTRAGPLRGQGSTVLRSASFFLFLILRVSVLDKENNLAASPSVCLCDLAARRRKKWHQPLSLLVFTAVVAKGWVIALYYTRRKLIFK